MAQAESVSTHASDALSTALHDLDRLSRDRRFGQLLNAATLVLRNHPESAAAYLHASTAAYQLGDWTSAYAFAEAAFRLRPSHSETGLLFLGAAMAEGRTAEAEHTIREAFGSDQAGFARQAVTLQAQLLSSADHRHVDQRQLGRMLALVDDNVDVLPVDLLWEVARVLMRLRCYSDATRVLTEALATGDGDRLPPSAWAFICEAVGDDVGPCLPEREAEARTESAKRLVTAGLAARATNRVARARALFGLAAALGPDNVSARINAGFAEFDDGNIYAASGHFAALGRRLRAAAAEVAWPQHGLDPWPHCQFGNAAAFDSLKPEGCAWPLMTIITTSRNHARSVEDSILSVVHQGYPRLQHIIIDRCSTDGTVEVIGKHERHFDRCIETEAGPAEALNEALRLARGAIIACIDAGDMLAPGALHTAALAWLRSDADLVHGMSLTHADGQLEEFARFDGDRLTLVSLADLHDYWRKGLSVDHPEVFFTRRILDRAGGQFDASLKYAMAYDLWLRCARLGAKVEPVRWPVVFRRRSDQPDTAASFDGLLEQAQVRDRVVQLAPPPERRRDIERRLGLALAGSKPRVQVEIVTSRLFKLFSKHLPDDLAPAFAHSRYEPRLVLASTSGGERDLMVRMVHLQNDRAAMQQLRDDGFDGPVVAWFWDNHHQPLSNWPAAAAADVVVPGHGFAAGYLSNRQAIQLDPVPLSIGQWSAREMRRYFAETVGRSRSDSLYGGFFQYVVSMPRNRLVAELIDSGCRDLVLLDDENFRRYSDRSGAERFGEWMQYKVSLCLPVAGDLSLRLFEALATGQVPIVSADIADLDAVIPPDLQAKLPIIKFHDYTVDAVLAAHRSAIAAFDALGEDGVYARHRYALEHHAFEVRVGQLLARLETLLGP